MYFFNLGEDWNYEIFSESDTQYERNWCIEKLKTQPKGGKYRHPDNPSLILYCYGDYKNGHCDECAAPNTFYNERCGDCFKEKDGKTFVLYENSKP